VVGLLVDDAIVEVENIVRHLREGKTPKRAALDAAQEIGLAVIGTSLTLVAIFVPVAFMPGVSGRFFKQFAITCAVAVLFSLIVARLITPMLAAYQLKSKPEQEQTGPIFNTYINTVRWTLQNRGKTLLAALAVFVVAMSAARTLPSGFLSADDRGELNVNVVLPPGADLDTTRTAVAQVQQILRTQSEVTQIYSNIKIGSATVQVRLVNFADRKRNQQEIQQALTPSLAQVTGARVTFAAIGFGETLNVALAGDSPDSLSAAAARLEHELRTIANIGGVSSSAELLKPEIAVKPDFAKMAELGITSAALSDAIRIGTTGDNNIRLPKLSLPARQIPIRIQLDADALKTIDTLRLLRIPTRSSSTPLSSIATIELSSGPAQISRFDRHRNVSLAIPLNGQPMSELTQKVFALPALKQLPAGVELQQSGDLERQSQLKLAFLLAMVTGIFCVYGVLALLFNDLLQPITILLALPLSLGGAVAALAIGGYPLALPSMIGLLMLMGIAVKNSILLVDYAVLGEEQGLQRIDALLDACTKRARPIVMTSIAMGAGMLPSALNLSGNNGFRAPMGMAVLGGLITSTILSLLVIPAAYTYIADFESWTKRWRHRLSVHD
jgi:multidrug efflux pump subunit AcrB